MSTDRRELLARLHDIRSARVLLTQTIMRDPVHNSSTGVTNVLEFIACLNEFLRDTLTQLDFPGPAIDRVVSFLSQFEAAETSPPDFFGMIRHGLNWCGPPSSTPLRSFSPR